MRVMRRRLALSLALFALLLQRSEGVPSVVHDLSNVTRAFEAYLSHFGKDRPQSQAEYTLRASYFEVRPLLRSLWGERGIGERV